MRLTKTKVFFLVLAIALVGFAPPAFARTKSDSTQMLVYDPQDNPVADRTVHLDVNKLDRDTHEYVKGAKLQIIEKETGDVVMSWTTGESTYSSERDLDIDVPYILHEESAPEGFVVAEDVEFILRSVDFETKGEVLSGAQTKDGETNAEFNNVAGDIETQAFVISLYDAETPAYKEEVEHRKRTTEVEEQSKEGKRGTGELTKTGDDTSFLSVIALAAAGTGVLVVALIKRKK